ncbi:MAG: hypothetical protein KBD57_12840 [Bacteroidia bacterium]|nr:hypothetical protein [Bacteroidia bacterium]
MHISKIYIQDNFIPNINIDQFRRKVFGMEITIKEGEDVGQAISEAETHIANYIKINTVPMDDECRGTKVMDLPNDENAEDKIKEEYLSVEAKLNEIEFQEDAIEFLNTTTFKHFIPAKTIANSKPIKNK